MSWLIIGGDGQLGLSFRDLLTKQNIPFDFSTIDTLDITDEKAVDLFVQQRSPSVVVNCAAWTAVDAAEDNESAAHAVNCDGARFVARAANNVGAIYVLVSTDYVFPGNATTPYKEDDPTGPVSVYGKTKLCGELAALQEHPSNTYIVRTAWLYSQYGKNFARTIARKGLAGDNLSVVNDSYGQPTSALAVARQIVALVTTHPPAGIFHATNAGSATWHEFASAIVDPIANHGSVTPVSSSAFPTVAIRPTYSVLDHTEWSANGISDMPHWRDSLGEIHSTILDSVKE